MHPLQPCRHPTNDTFDSKFANRKTCKHAMPRHYTVHPCDGQPTLAPNMCNGSVRCFGKPPFRGWGRYTTTTTTSSTTTPQHLSTRRLGNHVVYSAAAVHSRLYSLYAVDSMWLEIHYETIILALRLYTTYYTKMPPSFTVYSALSILCLIKK